MSIAGITFPSKASLIHLIEAALSHYVSLTENNLGFSSRLCSSYSVYNLNFLICPIETNNTYSKSFEEG